MNILQAPQIQLGSKLNSCFLQNMLFLPLKSFLVNGVTILLPLKADMKEAIFALLVYLYPINTYILLAFLYHLSPQKKPSSSSLTLLLVYLSQSLIVSCLYSLTGTYPLLILPFLFLMHKSDTFY